MVDGKIGAHSYLWVQNGSDDPIQVTPDDMEDDTIDGESTMGGEPIKKLKQSFKDKYNIS